MAIIDLKLPPMGESIIEATIIHWNKEEGDAVEEDETVLEVATDKVDSEVPSSVEGTIKEILFQENEVVPIGETIARIEISGEVAVEEEEDLLLLDDDDDEEGEGEKDDIEVEGKEIKEEKEEKREDITQEKEIDNSRFYSPLVMKIAGEEGVSLSELEKINGNGRGGRVTKKDILHYVEKKRSGIIETEKIEKVATESELNKVAGNQTIAKLEKTGNEANVEVVKMDRRRKIIAEHMVQSKRISPHVTSFSEADVTNVVKWRNKFKHKFREREGEKLTFTPLFIEAIVKCIKRFPLINSAVEGDNILIKKDINIGMATALEDGSLIVPVIKRADQLNLVGLAKQVNGLAKDARSGNLVPDAVREGTFTMTNVGTFDSLAGTPIINQPQVAILAVGAIKKKAVVVETEQGDSIAIRHMMYLSMSYDHRVVDGSLGATFLTAVARELENFDLNRAL